MRARSQTSRSKLVLLALLCLIPSLAEAYAVIWGEAQGMTGKALRDGLDFWAGGTLALHGQVALLFDPVAYNGFLHGIYGKLPMHLWSYPPNYLLVAAGFDRLPPWPAVLAFDAASLALLMAVLRLAGLSGWLVAAVAFSPASFENVLEGQNAALITALIGGGLLLLPSRPRLGGLLVGLASIKPQLGLVLPLYLLRRSPIAFLYAALAACALAAASLAAFGAVAWVGFWQFTRPAMDAVLLTGKPPEFAGGLISVFAAVRFLGVHNALLVQGAVTLAAVVLAARAGDAVPVLILAALASPYLHDYDLLGVTLALALLTQDRLERGFLAGEAALFFCGWFGPGLLPWLPRLAHLTPLVLALLLASAKRRGRLTPCDSLQVPPGSPASSAGRLPIRAAPDSTAPGWSGTE
jgi:hypothetical protein